MKTNKIIYWIATGLMSILMTMSAGMYFFKTEEISEVFIALGYNERIVIPLAILKLLAVAAIVSDFSSRLKEWAYFGLLVDFVLALEGHLAARDGGFGAAVIALILWSISYFFYQKIKS